MTLSARGSQALTTGSEDSYYAAAENRKAAESQENACTDGRLAKQSMIQARGTRVPGASCQCVDWQPWGQGSAGRGLQACTGTLSGTAMAVSITATACKHAQAPDMQPVQACPTRS